MEHAAILMKEKHAHTKRDLKQVTKLASLVGFEVHRGPCTTVKFVLIMKDGSQICKFQIGESLERNIKFNLKHF